MCKTDCSRKQPRRRKDCLMLVRESRRPWRIWHMSTRRQERPRKLRSYSKRRLQTQNLDIQIRQSSSSYARFWEIWITRIDDTIKLANPGGLLCTPRDLVRICRGSEPPIGTVCCSQWHSSNK